MNSRYKVDRDPTICDAALRKAGEPLCITDQILTWCLVHGALQLAMRHPQLAGTLSPVTLGRLTDFVAKLGFALVDAGFLTPEILAESVRREREFHAPKLTNG